MKTAVNFSMTDSPMRDSRGEEICNRQVVAIVVDGEIAFGVVDQQHAGYIDAIIVNIMNHEHRVRVHPSGVLQIRHSQIPTLIKDHVVQLSGIRLR